MSAWKHDQEGAFPSAQPESPDEQLARECYEEETYPVAEEEPPCAD